MQHLMSNRSIRKVSIGRRKELNAVGIDDNCEVALTLRSALVQSGIEDYVDV